MITSREFETYFRRLYLPLGMYALRIVDNADDAEDIVEDTFMKAWQAISSVQRLNISTHISTDV